jgi:FkbM family methyltransferase
MALWGRKPAFLKAALGLPGAFMHSSLFPLDELRPEFRARNEDICRHLCANAYLGDYFGVLRVLCRVLGRYKMYVDPNDHGLSPHLILDGFWEMPTTEALAELVKPGMVVGDIGANLGYFTLLMADLVGPSGRVFAFEPNPAMTFRLGRSVSLNGFTKRVETCEVLLCDENEKLLSFLMPSDEPKNAYARPFEGTELTGAVLLKGCRLDSRPEWQAIELLKIDAEGSEQLIWEGMAGLLQGDRLHTIVMEVRLDRYADSLGFLHMVTQHGFNMAYIDGAAGIVPLGLSEMSELPIGEDMMLVFRR